MSGKEKEEPKGEGEREKRKSKTALLAGIALGFCIILGGYGPLPSSTGKRQWRKSAHRPIHRPKAPLCLLKTKGLRLQTS